MRVLLVLCALLIAVPGCSQQGGPRESEHKTETAHEKEQNSKPLQHLLPPAGAPAAPIVNVYTGKHAGEESHCAGPKDWKEWSAFAWCRSIEWIDAERIIAIWTVVLGIATCILGIATVRLWRATDRLVAGAEETAVRQLRAYVEITSIEMFPQNAATNTKFTHKLGILNTGQTPAYEVVFDHRTCVLDHPIAESFDTTLPVDPHGSKSTLGPGREYMSDSEMTEIIPDELMAEVKKVDAAKRIYTYGIVRYTDAFKQNRTTKFCLFFQAMIKPDGSVRTLVNTAKYHNKST